MALVWEEMMFGALGSLEMRQITAYRRSTTSIRGRKMCEKDLRVGCLDEFRLTYPRPPLVDVCWHNMAVQSKLSQIIDWCIHHDNPYNLIMEEAKSAKQVLRAATDILYKNFGEEDE
ncbi:MAG: hypothetical protein ACYS7Y_30105 [Planctomycetota bacterium]